MATRFLGAAGKRERRWAPASKSGALHAGRSPWSHVPRLDDMQVGRNRRTSRKDSAGHCLRDAKYCDGIAPAAERHRRQGFRLDTGLIPHGLRYEQRRSKFLIQRLDPKCDVHDVSDYRVLLAIGRPDIADDGRAGVQRDTDPRRGRVARGHETVELEHDLARGGKRVRAIDTAVRQRRAEHGEEPVAENLFTMPPCWLMVRTMKVHSVFRW